MTNTITESYCTWLQKYTLKKGCPHKMVALSLMKQIKGVESITALQKIVLDCPIKPLSHSVVGTDTSDCFVSRLNIFKEQIKLVADVDLEATRSRINTIVTNERTKDVITLLESILAIPQVLLYPRTPSLLYKIRDNDTLQKIVDHLGIPPKSPVPRNPRRGSFDALTVSCNEQETCLTLLRDNNSEIASSGDAGEKANHFLQLMLCLYEDISSAATRAFASEQSSCSIL